MKNASELSEADQTLWDQVKDLAGPWGERLSGEPEVLHEIQMWLSGDGGFPVTREQIELILNNVPRIFSEDWKNPGNFSQLTEEQQEAGKEIASASQSLISGEAVQQVIRFGVIYRNLYKQPKL